MSVHCDVWGIRIDNGEYGENTHATTYTLRNMARL